MFVLRQTFDTTVASYNADNLRLRQELADERADKHKLAEALRSSQVAVEQERESLAVVARNMHQAIKDGSESSSAVIGKELEALRMELAVERAKRELLAGQLALSQKDCEWLRLMINTAHTERAALLAQVGMSVPVPQIRDYRVPMAPPPADERVGLHNPESGIGSGLPGPLQELMDEAGGFEDMGDAAAARHGIGHDTTGALHFGPLGTQTEG